MLACQAHYQYEAHSGYGIAVDLPGNALGYALDEVARRLLAWHSSGS
jgi:hypothetical protein